MTARTAVQPLAELVGVRDPVRDAGVGDLAAGAGDPLRDRGLRLTRNAPAIWAGVSPHTTRRVSATCASCDSAGWQQVKISRSRSSSRRLGCPGWPQPTRQLPG